MAKIKLLGTSHVSADSVASIKKAIDTLDPEFVCVELDKGRLEGMLSGKKSISPRLMFKVGFGGYAFLLFGAIVQKTLAKKVNLVPGQDMLTAVQYAKGRKVALIDQPVQITLKRISNVLTFWRMCKIAWKSLFGKRSLVHEFETMDMNTVPKQEVIDKLLVYMKHEHPELYGVLLEERNHYMVKRIKSLTKQHPDSVFLVVVGAAHVSGMKELLSQ